MLIENEKFIQDSDLLTCVDFFLSYISAMLISKAEEIFARLCSLIIHQETEEVIDDARLDYLHIWLYHYYNPCQICFIGEYNRHRPFNINGFSTLLNFPVTLPYL